MAVTANTTKIDDMCAASPPKKSWNTEKNKPVVRIVPAANRLAPQAPADKLHYKTRHENFHGKFSLCAEYLIRSIGQKVLSRYKVLTDYSDVFIWEIFQIIENIALHIKVKSGKVGQ